MECGEGRLESQDLRKTYREVTKGWHPRTALCPHPSVYRRDCTSDKPIRRSLAKVTQPSMGALRAGLLGAAQGTPPNAQGSCRGSTGAGSVPGRRTGGLQVGS